MIISEEDLKHLTRKQCVRFGLFCCYQIEHLWNKNDSLTEEVKIIEQWCNGNVTFEEFQRYQNILNFNDTLDGNVGIAYATIYYTGRIVDSPVYHNYAVAVIQSMRDFTMQHSFVAAQARLQWIESYTIKGVTNLILKEKT